jgi:hypothetical protein
VRRLVGSLVATLMIAALGVPVVAAAPAPPKVVFIVGPVGPDATARYRAQADEAARIARRYTPDVVKVYSPDATWPAVRKALQGASVVVYMGHGNGWPSKYRDHLFPPTQNGFGLNPVAGEGDSRHQYFGEAAVGSHVKLAKDAVVLLHHLCYASGNTEPGLPEGTLAQAKQRVDNYAAGFIKAGASAVIAEAWTSPAWMVRQVLGSDRSIERIWKASPIRNGNFLSFPSDRSRGYVAMMDPDRRDSGFHRSLVLREGLASRDVRAGGQGGGSSAPVPPDAGPDVPTLIPAGLTLETPRFDALTSAGAETALRLPFAVERPKELPEKLGVSVRWDPIETETSASSPEPTPDATSEATPEPTPDGTPDATPDATPETARPDVARAVDGEKPGAPPETPAPTPAPLAPASQPEEAPTPPPPPEVPPLVQPERLGDVVEPVRASVAKERIKVALELPETPGLYRLTVTLHDPEGVAYDAATQALVPSLIVRVVGPHDALITAAPAATLEAGTNVPLDVRVSNVGATPWGHPELDGSLDPDGGSPASAATLVAHWIALSGATQDQTPSPVRAAVPAGLKTGVTVDATLDLAVPLVAGEYLLVLDIVTPEHGSLAALGVAPTTVRISVVDPPD